MNPFNDPVKGVIQGSGGGGPGGFVSGGTEEMINAV